MALVGLSTAAALGNYAMTQGAGTNFGSVVVGGVHYAQQFICDLTTPAQCATVSAAGAVKVDGSATTQPVSGTVAATQSGAWVVSGTGTAGSAASGVMTVQGVASMTPLFMQSGTTPVVTMNSASANSGVNSALAGVFDDAAPTAITENSFGFLRMSTNRNLYGTIRDAAGNERGANVNASNQLAIAGPVTVVSGGIASGAVASGAVASGAFASGSIASGALASGSVASGAMVDLGAQADSACGTAAGTCSLIALQKYANTALGGAIPTQAATVPIGGVGLVAGGAVGTYGSAFPAVGLALGLSDATNMRAWLQAANGLNTTGTGIASAQAVGQFDDVSPTAITENQFGNLRMSANRNLYGTIRDAAGNERGANVSAAGALSVDGSAVTQPSSPVASATGGATPSGGIAAATNNSTNLKGSAGTVYGVQTSNINGSTAYWLKLYDKATAPTCGTDTPVKRVLIPPSNSGNNMTFPVGIAFSLGIGYCVVTGIADNDNTSVPAATIAFSVDWK